MLLDESIEDTAKRIYSLMVIASAPGSGRVPDSDVVIMDLPGDEPLLSFEGLRTAVFYCIKLNCHVDVRLDPTAVGYPNRFKSPAAIDSSSLRITFSRLQLNDSTIWNRVNGDNSNVPDGWKPTHSSIKTTTFFTNIKRKILRWIT